MSIETISSFMAGISPLKVDSSLCTRYITPRSTCNKCIEGCPSKCISFNSDRIDIGRCNYCGLCVTNCPNYVFKLDEGVLINNCFPDSPLILSCHSYLDNYKGSEKSAVTKINCLWQLYPELLIKLLARGQCVVILIDGSRCGGCLGFDAASLQLNLKAYTDVFDNLGQLSVVNSWQELEPFLSHSRHQEAQGLDRRLFFKAIWKGVQKLPQKALSTALEKLELEGHGQAVSSASDAAQNLAENSAGRSNSPFKKQHLLEALRCKEPQNVHKTLPYRKLQCGKCSFCGACTRLCPTNALQIVPDGDTKQLRFIPGCCTECSICLEVCVFNCLTWSSQVTVAELLKEDPMPISSANKQVCDQCKQEFWLSDTGDNNLCSWCLSRSMHNQEVD